MFESIKKLVQMILALVEVIKNSKNVAEVMENMIKGEQEEEWEPHASNIVST